jgi:hypothetical protein
LLNAAPSRAHSNVAPASELKLKLALVELALGLGLSVIVVSGAAESIVQLCEAGVASGFPAASLACTENVCEPSASPAYSRGLLQVSKAPLSKEHSNVAPASEVNEKLAPAELVVAAGPLVSVVSGAVESIVQAKEAGVASVLPAASLARTEKLCSPSARPAYSFGLVQASYAPASSAHSKLAPGSELKLKAAVGLLAGLAGCASIVVSGALESIVQAKLAEVGSVFPAASRARTEKLCEPSPRPVNSFGLVQASKAPASSAHSNVASASEVKEKLALLELVLASGPPTIDVSGAAESTIHVKEAGLASVLPAASVARTWNVREPSARPL